MEIKKKFCNKWVLYRWYYFVLLFCLSTIFTLNQIYYESFKRVNAQIFLYLKQIGYQLNEPQMIASLNLPIQSVNAWSSPLSIFFGFSIFGLIFLRILFNEYTFESKQSFTRCFMKTIFSPIVIVFIILLLFFLLLQTQIGSLVNQIQLFGIHHFMKSDSVVFSKLQEISTNHFTVKLPSTYEGLLQMNQLTNHEWTLLIVKIILKNMVLFVFSTFLVYFIMFVKKSPIFSNRFSLFLTNRHIKKR